MPRTKESLWSHSAETAALLVAQDRITDRAIAKRVGVTRSTLFRWKARPQFQTRVEQHREAWREKIDAESIADRKARVAALQSRWVKMRQVIDERGAEMGNVAGGKTGLLTRRQKQIGGGKDAQIVEEYEVDTGLLKELREHERQAAIEMGQWQESGQPLKPGEARLTVTYDAIQQIQATDPERWRRIEAAARAIAAEERQQDGAVLAHQATSGASAGPG